MIVMITMDDMTMEIWPTILERNEEDLSYFNFSSRILLLPTWQALFRELALLDLKRTNAYDAMKEPQQLHLVQTSFTIVLNTDIFSQFDTPS